MTKFYSLFVLQILSVVIAYFLTASEPLLIGLLLMIIVSSCITVFLAYQQSVNLHKSEAVKQDLAKLQNELEEVQENLEATVQERTLELHIALQELEEANKILEQQNTLDELTGVYNRRYYDKRIIAELRRSRRNLSPLSLLVIDIDHFKQVNDKYGHAVGDECIKAIANLLTQYASRSGDRVCRYGGEEFCIILADTDQSGAMAIADKIRQAVEDSPVSFAEHLVKLTISIGLSVYQQDTPLDGHALFDNADKALYQAKQQGRNQIKVA